MADQTKFNGYCTACSAATPLPDLVLAYVDGGWPVVLCPKCDERLMLSGEMTIEREYHITDRGRAAVGD